VKFFERRYYKVNRKQLNPAYSEGKAMNEERQVRLHQAIEQAQREQRDFEKYWAGFRGATGASSWSAIFAVMGIFFGVVAGADDGGWVPVIGGIVGCCIGYAIPKALRFVFITLPQTAWYGLRRMLRTRR
jgi:hypothetical protein